MNKKIFLIMFALSLIYLPIATAQEPQASDALTNITTKFSAGLEQPLHLPTAIETLAKILLGIKQSPTLTITLLVAASCIWLFLFFILAETLNLTPFFNGNLRWIGAALMTLLIALSGAIESITLYITSFAFNFWFFEDWSAGALTFIVIIFLVGGFIISKILRQAKFYNEKVRAHMQGMKAGINDAYVEERRKSEKDFGGD